MFRLGRKFYTLSFLAGTVFIYLSSILLSTGLCPYHMTYKTNPETILDENETSPATIYGVTPTYKRLTQKADLTRLWQTLLHVPNFHWIVVEDSSVKTQLVGNLLNESGLVFTHLNAKTNHPKLNENNKKEKQRSWSKGIDQRNAALIWIRRNVARSNPDVIYFMDDDNAYSLKVFKEMRSTKQASCWLIAFSGGLKYEGPTKCRDGKVFSWNAAWGRNRKFPLDMCAFAINIKLIFKYPQALFSYQWPSGFLETNFLSSLNLTKSDMEAKSNCSQVLAWHVKTQTPIISYKSSHSKSSSSLKEIEV